VEKLKMQDKFQTINLRWAFICSLIIICDLLLGNWYLPSLYAQDKIVAIVNNAVITQKDLNDFIHFMRIQLSKEYSASQVEKKVQDMKKDLLDRLIEDRLILQEAKKDNVNIDEGRVKAKVNEIKKRYQTEAEFQEDLAKQGLVQADIESKIREQLLMYNIIDQKIRNKILIRPDEVTEFYNKNMGDFRSPEERELEIIKLENEDLAKSFSYNLKTGQKLADLATRYPIKVDKLTVTKRGELRKEIEDVVFKLLIGDVSEPLKVDDQYYVFKLDNLSSSRQLPLSEVQDRIHTYLFNKKMQEKLSDWLDELKGQSYIKVMP